MHIVELLKYQFEDESNLNKSYIIANVNATNKDYYIVVKVSAIFIVKTGVREFGNWSQNFMLEL